MPHRPGNGAIFGVVSEEGQAKQDFPVTLIDRSNGKMVDRQMTDHNGGFVFNGLNQDTDDYQVIAQDEDGETYKNAIIRDRIQPVRGYQGAIYHGNWRRRAGELGVLMFYDGYVAKDYQDISKLQEDYVESVGSGLIGPAGSFYPPLVALGETTDQNGFITKPTFEPSMTPGDPGIPTTVLDDQKIWTPAMSTIRYPGDAGYQENPANMALETVIDFGSLSAPSGWCGILAALNRAGYSSWARDYTPHLMSIMYNVSGKYARLAIDAGDNDEPWYSRNRTNIGDVDLTEYQGVHHFVFSVVFGVEAKVYIDGALIETIPIPNTSATQSYATSSTYGYPGPLILAGEYNSRLSARSLRGVSGRVGVMAYYGNSLSDSDVQSLYEDLIVGTEPSVTGYEKEVLTERPCFYLPLDNTPGTTKFHNAVGPTKYKNMDGKAYGPLSFHEPSIVVGGHTVGFDGDSGIRFENNGPLMQNPLGYSLCFVAKPELVAPDQTEQILRTTGYSDNYDYGIWLRRLSDGRFRITTKNLAGNTEHIEFDYLQDNKKLHHYLFSVDKVEGVAVLYVDGVEAETQSTTGAEVLIPQYTSTSTSSRYRHIYASIGASIDRSSNLSSGYRGLLGSFWVSSNPTSAQRARQLYEATKVV